jgi:aldose 1-epimerase
MTMPFAVREVTQPGVKDRDPTVYVLEDGAGGEARVWPALGFNCFCWRAVRDGRVLELLYSDPALFVDGRPTRSGIPVLFPFPNRIRDGRFVWDGKDYRLPPNDPAGKNAIHGFACRTPWRVAGRGADASGAWLRGAWRCSTDAPQCRPLWPADQEIELTYRLGDGTLRVEAEVRNPDSVPLPFGLGYHPYLAVPPVPGASPEDCTVCAPARSFWVLEESLPTGQKAPVGGERDLNTPRKVSELHLDDVLTDLPPAQVRPDGVAERAWLRAGGAEVRVAWSPEFREAVVFTPPHRHAFCVEPYTCVTDAVNLQARGVEAGWRVLPPGGTFRAVVELRV